MFTKKRQDNRTLDDIMDEILGSSSTQDYEEDLVDDNLYPQQNNKYRNKKEMSLDDVIDGILDPNNTTDSYEDIFDIYD